MNIIRHFLNLFHSNKAIAFVDYEYWYYSYKNLFGLQPDLASWVQELRSQYDLADVKVYADFSSPGLSGEKRKLLAVTGSVIDTEAESPYRKKDMTDFVMLDSLYQSVNHARKIGTYILFTGDGHFNSVVRYITDRKHKKVIIYGVQDSISRRLQESATDCIALPLIPERTEAYRRMIIENLAYVMDKPDIIPTFLGTVTAVSRKYGVNSEEVQRVLSDMIEQGYVVRKERLVGFRKNVRIVAANWDKLIEEGYWDSEEQRFVEQI